MTELAKRRNPPWSYDELVLAMDLYVRRGIPNAADPDVVELSELLNRLQAAQGTDAQPTLRNPNGVYLKLCNFRAKDRPGHGMAHGNHLEHDVWDRFAHNKSDLYREAVAIKSRLRTGALGVRSTRDPGIDGPLVAPDELRRWLPKSGRRRETTEVLMDLVRKVAELETLFAREQELAKSDATELRNSLNDHLQAILVLLAQFAHAQQLGNFTAPYPASTGDRADAASRNAAHAGKLVIFPCGDPSSVRHFNRTVRRPVDLTALGLPDRLSQVVPDGYPTTEARVWGVMPRASGVNETRFKRCGIGDVAIFTGGGKAFSAATIRATLRSSDLARALWHTDASGETWELMFLLSDPIEFAMPYSELNKARGYQSTFAYQAFFVLSEEAARLARQSLDEIGHLWA